MAKKPDVDEATLHLMGRMVHMPPKPHDQMKIGKGKASRAKSRDEHRAKPQAKKPS